MRVKKIFAAGMVAVMCAGLMTGCGSNDTKSQFKKFSKCATIDKAAYTDIEYVPALYDQGHQSSAQLTLP